MWSHAGNVLAKFLSSIFTNWVFQNPAAQTAWRIFHSIERKWHKSTVNGELLTQKYWSSCITSNQSNNNECGNSTPQPIEIPEKWNEMKWPEIKSNENNEKGICLNTSASPLNYYWFWQKKWQKMIAHPSIHCRLSITVPLNSIFNLHSLLIGKIRC